MSDLAGDPNSAAETFVTFGQLAKMLGSGWTRSTVWYWADRAGIATVSMPGLPFRFVRRSSVNEVMIRLRTARAGRANDGHGQHGRPRRPKL